MELDCFQLDDYHALSKLVDKDGIYSWWLFTFQNPIKNGVVECSMNPHTKEFFHMEQIDPNDFEWNGRSVKLIVNEG